MPVEKQVNGSGAGAGTATTVGTSANGLTGTMLNIKDNRWLQVEVCREFQRGQCSRSDIECKFAHPPPHVEVKEGRVTACYDSIKGRCTRENPKCKYLHPPQHLKDQLLINGRNNLVIKNLLANQMSAQMTAPLSISPIAAVPGTSALIPNIAAAASYNVNPYATYALNAAAFYPGLVSASPDPFGMINGFVPAANSAATIAAMQKMVSNRAERVETAAAAAHALSVPNSYPYMAAAHAAATLASLGKKRPLEPEIVPATASYNEQLLLAAAALNSPMNKRAAMDKGGIPYIQPIYQTVPTSLGTALHYPHLTIPGLTAASYMVPAAPYSKILVAGNPTSLARF